MQSVAEIAPPATESPPRARPAPGWGRALGALAAVCGTLLALRFLVPTRMEGARGGLTGALAWLGDEHPLVLGVALFLALSATVQYWTTRRGPAARVPRASVPIDPAVRRRSTRRFVVALVAAGVAAVVVRSSLVATFRVSGPSMLPTLEFGDRVLVNRLAYGFKLPLTKARIGARPPARGDLVVFPSQGLVPGERAQEVVKRVIGLPGDHITFAEGGVTINGWPIPTCDAGSYVAITGRLIVRGRLTVEFLADKTYLTVHTPFDTERGSYRVKPGEAFVMGDDRGISSDSRIWNERRAAGVPFRSIEGRVNRVLLGGLPDGRLDLSRLLAPPLDLKVRLRGIDLAKTEERINACLKERPAQTWPPALGSGQLADG